ncbi:MAG: DUF2272 domain-containing protein [Fimbriimonadaceae bacterium]|nr:DUF2272 domain-containing protein [Fimbriimonadaceae bacterium]
MNKRVDVPEANFRATPGTSQAPLGRMPIGHLVVTSGAAQGGWQPCTTTLDGHGLQGFVSASLLRDEINPFVDKLVEAAGIEYKAFLFGTRHENHPDSVPRIAQYWRSFQATAEPVSTAWSAAFISFVVRKAALTKSFQFAGRHTTYLSDSKRARQANDATRAYWAVRLSERALQIGDLVGAYRTGDGCGSAVRTYDSLPGDFCAHCDLVVAIRGGKALTIGGNVSNTVKVTEVPLTPQGFAQTGSRRIAIMARNF